MEDLSIIQKTYDFIVWFVPILNRLPRDHKFLLGDRIIAGLYDLLENLTDAQYAKVKVPKTGSPESKTIASAPPNPAVIGFRFAEGQTL